MQTLADSTVTHEIKAPIDSIDLTQWLFTLTDEEYQACSTAHIAGAVSRTGKNARMSINVEMLGEDLVIEHYVEDISEKQECRVASTSDVFTKLGRTKIEVIWTVKVEKTSDSSCEFSNRVTAGETQPFAEMLGAHKITDARPISAEMQKNAEAHNREETPNFAANIERKALAGVWK